MSTLVSCGAYRVRHLDRYRCKNRGLWMDVTVVSVMLEFGVSGAVRELVLRVDSLGFSFAVLGGRRCAWKTDLLSGWRICWCVEAFRVALENGSVVRL